MCKGLSEQCSTQDNQKCDKDVGEHIRYEQTIQEGNLGLEDPIGRKSNLLQCVAIFYYLVLIL